MSPKRAREHAEIKGRHEKVLALVGSNKSLTAAQIIAELPDVSIGTIGHLVKIGDLVAHPTGMRTKNCNHIYAYALAGEKPKLEPVKKAPQLWDLWPASIPQTSARPRVVFDMDKELHYGMAAMTPHLGCFGMQSSMVSLINAMG